MPKAPVNENHHAKPGQDDVWSTREVGSVQAESKAVPVQLTADTELCYAVLASNSRHGAGALLARQVIGHWS